jgi:hypothetical protein
MAGEIGTKTHAGPQPDAMSNRVSMKPQFRGFPHDVLDVVAELR